MLQITAQRVAEGMTFTMATSAVVQGEWTRYELVRTTLPMDEPPRGAYGAILETYYVLQDYLRTVEVLDHE